MTPPSAEVTAGRLPRRPAPRAPRRVSGPGRRPWRSGVRARAARRRASRPAQVLAWLRALPDARLLDRLVRGRGWIALVGVGLIGIVFLQVSLLNLNAGISRAVTAAETLERQNASLREDISQLDAGERLAGGAAKLGLIMPSAGEVTFLDARQADGRRAAAGIRPPKPVPPSEVAAAAQAAPGGTAAGTATAATATTTAAAPGTTATTTAPAAAPAAATSVTTATGVPSAGAGTAATGTPSTSTPTPTPTTGTTGGAPAGTATTASTTSATGAG